jgi:hypothetical protein
VIAPDDFPIPDRPPLNLSLVLDKSGAGGPHAGEPSGAGRYPDHRYIR